MFFKKYSEIENVSNSKYLQELEYQGFFNEDIEYVVENKIDGSNVQCSIDEKGEFNFGSRNQPYPSDADFQGSQLCFLKENVKNKLIQLKKIIAVNLSLHIDMFVLTVYGELCGGMYRHPAVEKVMKAIKIQGRVDYHPDNKWIPFDIVVSNIDGTVICGFNQDAVVKYCKEVSLPYPIILFRGTLKQCLDYPVEFIDKTGQILWGLPVIENNVSEGVVIKPNKFLRMNNGRRVILKNKSEKFKERSCSRKSVEHLPMTDNELKWFSVIKEFVTESRLMSVISKLDVTKLNDKSFGIILGAYLKDLWNDFDKEYERDILKEHFDFNFAKVRKEASKYIAKFIQPYFVELLKK